MGSDKYSLTPLKDIIAKLAGDGALPFNPDDARIWKVWEDVVGPGISRHAQPLWIKEGRLRIEVSDPIWLQELSFLKEDIRKKLNKRLSREVVTKMEFRAGFK